MNLDTNSPAFLHQFRPLDIAPAQEITAADHDRRETMLFGILVSEQTSQAHTPKSTRRKLIWGAIGASTILAGAAAFGVVAAAPTLFQGVHSAIAGGSDGPLPSTQLAAWTSTPTTLSVNAPLAKKAEQWCVTNLTGVNGATGSPTITNLDARGQVASMFYTVDGSTYYCLSGGDGAGLWEKDDIAVPANVHLTPSTIGITSAGSHGDTDGLSYAVGFTGADVTGITLHEPGDKTVVATVENGRWSAWWPTPGAESHGGPSGTVTVTTRDGKATTVDSSTIYPN